ncbi:MAG: hypothetical protein KF901_03235 [Myxococcales bacterium]|nr:hypothetical protein [Myxococcales bacterium]
MDHNERMPWTFAMGWQAWAAGAVVLLAVAYLVWKLGIAPRRPRVRRGPDVPVSRLVRKRDKSCH